MTGSPVRLPESVMLFSARNATTWRAADVVEEYTRADDLQVPEKAILELLGDRLAQMRMLDLGVGGGRTTLHFRGRVREYVGLDYSAEMIAACKRRFAAEHANGASASFLVGDARAMDEIPSSSFDFILFSFNGIDYVSASERNRVFSEVNRVGSDGGLFFFSTHNLQCLHTFGDKFRRSEYVVINDGVHGGRFYTYYVRPAAQVKYLRRYFGGITVYSLKTGLPLPAGTALQDVDEPWLYYLCTIQKPIST